MHPGSIYAAFGSKDGLFKEVLGFYSSRAVARLEGFVQAAPSPLIAVKMFVKDSVARSESAPSDICMLVKTVCELTEDNEELLAEAKRLLSEMEDRFVALLAQAQAQGEVTASKDPAHLARYLQVQLIGLRGYARVSDRDEYIDALLDDIFSKGLT